MPQQNPPVLLYFGNKQHIQCDFIHNQSKTKAVGWNIFIWILDAVFQCADLLSFFTLKCIFTQHLALKEAGCAHNGSAKRFLLISDREEATICFQSNLSTMAKFLNVSQLWLGPSVCGIPTNFPWFMSSLKMLQFIAHIRTNAEPLVPLCMERMPEVHVWRLFHLITSG